MKKELESKEIVGFSVSDIPPEWNYWDAGSAGSLVLACSSIVAGIWLAQKD